MARGVESGTPGRGDALRPLTDGQSGRAGPALWSRPRTSAAPRGNVKRDYVSNGVSPEPRPLHPQRLRCRATTRESRAGWPHHNGDACRDTSTKPPAGLDLAQKPQRTFQKRKASAITCCAAVRPADGKAGTPQKHSANAQLPAFSFSMGRSKHGPGPAPGAMRW